MIGKILLGLFFLSSNAVLLADESDSVLILFEEFIEGPGIEDRLRIHSDVFMHNEDQIIQLKFSILTLKYWDVYEAAMREDVIVGVSKDRIFPMRMRAMRKVLEFLPGEKYESVKDGDVWEVIVRDAEEKLGVELVISKNKIAGIAGRLDSRNKPASEISVKKADRSLRENELAPVSDQKRQGQREVSKKKKSNLPWIIAGVLLLVILVLFLKIRWTY